MGADRFRLGFVSLIAMAMGALGLSGCSEELGSDSRSRVTTRVTGIVLEGKEPVQGGWVEFLPTEGTVGVNRSARIGPDGRFAADGVAVGVNRVGLSGMTVRNPILRRLFEPLSSKVYRTIPAQPTDDMVIDLLQEAALQAVE
jgi:hypothetical protein